MDKYKIDIETIDLNSALSAIECKRPQPSWDGFDVSSGLRYETVIQLLYFVAMIKVHYQMTVSK